MAILTKRSFLSPLLMLFLGLSAEPAFSQVNRWAAFGPVGGSVTNLAIDPRNSSTLYAVSGGVFKSTDGGSNWRRLLGPDSYALSVHVDTLNSNNLYVATGKGVLKSTNAGMSWTE